MQRRTGALGALNSRGVAQSADDGDSRSLRLSGLHWVRFGATEFVAMQNNQATLQNNDRIGKRGRTTTANKTLEFQTRCQRPTKIARRYDAAQAVRRLTPNGDGG